MLVPTIENVAQVLNKILAKFPKDFFAIVLSTNMAVMMSGGIKECFKLFFKDDVADKILHRDREVGNY